MESTRDHDPLRRIALAPALVALLLAASPAAAQPAGGASAQASGSNAAAAQALFDSARQLIGAGRAGEACPKLEESQRLDPGLGTQFHLADCYERVGRTASAWSTFLELAAVAKSSGQGERETVARRRAGALEGRLVRLRIEVPSESRLPGLEVRRDNAAVGAAQWDVAVPVDPGEHEVHATAPGRVAWRTAVEAREAGEPVIVRVPVLETPATPVAGIPAASTSPSPSSPSARDAGARTRRNVGFVTGGVGLVGLGLGAFFGARSMSAGSDSEAHCNGDVCNATGVGLRDEAIDWGTASTVAFVAGGVLVAGGAVLVLTSRPSRPSAPSASVGLHLGPAGAMARGQW
jgi:serine/threonine-protein kinase